MKYDHEAAIAIVAETSLNFYRRSGEDDIIPELRLSDASPTTQKVYQNEAKAILDALDIPAMLKAEYQWGYSLGYAAGADNATPKEEATT